MATFPRKPSRLAGRCYWVAVTEVLKFYPELKLQVLGEDETDLPEMDDSDQFPEQLTIDSPADVVSDGSDGGTLQAINDQLDEAYRRLSVWERDFHD
jgi:hypothetical protein